MTKQNVADLKILLETHWPTGLMDAKVSWHTVGNELRIGIYKPGLKQSEKTIYLLFELPKESSQAV